MKKVINVSLGGRPFAMNEDAHDRLTLYLDHFRSRLQVPEGQKAEVMEEIESRIGELLSPEASADRVVTLEGVEQAVNTLGMPDGSAENGSAAAGTDKPRRKLYRDEDQKRIAGVCNGLSLYLDVDVTLIRVLMLGAFICGGAGFWIYLILWIAVPMAETPAQKCELRGLAASAENMAPFSNANK